MDTLPNNQSSAPVSTQSGLVQKYGTLVAQLIRFGVVGLLNTGIDFGILNVLSYLTGITEGGRVIPLKGVAFLAANVNSYIINKRWTFKDNTSGEGAKKFSVYLSVSVIGALINITVVYLITTYVPPVLNLSPRAWLNVANLAATALSLVWNFIGYKLIVFRGK